MHLPHLVGGRAITRSRINPIPKVTSSALDLTGATGPPVAPCLLWQDESHWWQWHSCESKFEASIPSSLLLYLESAAFPCSQYTTHGSIQSQIGRDEHVGVECT